MKKINQFSLLVIMLCISYLANSQSKEVQIKSAIMAAPEDMRENATVFGYNETGEFILLREGSGGLTCQADNPANNGFSVSCYPKELDRFIERGRELRAEGLARQEVFAARGEEIKAGTLTIPENATMHILYGPDDALNKETGEITGAKYRFIVYIPYATTETTGLPLKPSAPGAPWLMDAGSHRAHIMITPMN